MKKYLYELTDASGNFRCGKIESSSDSEALQRFDQDNLHYLSRTDYDPFENEVYEVVLVDSYGTERDLVE